MKAMILAAGLGTRLRPITEKFAKPAVPFLNIPLLYYPVFLMEQTGQIDGYVLNTHYHPEQIEALANKLKSSPFGARKITFSHEDGAPLGSGGGIWKARAQLEGGGSFMVANGDEVILPHDPNIMKAFIEKHRKSDALATILVMKHPLVGTQFGGVWADENGLVRGFGKNGAAFGPNVTGYHYIGLLLLSDRVFSYMPEGESNILYDTLVKGISSGERVETLCSEFTWFETGNPQDYLLATRHALDLFADGKNADAVALRSICDLYWKKDSRFFTEGDLRMIIAESAKVASSTKLTGNIVIGDRVNLTGNSSLDNSVILPDATPIHDANITNEIRF